MFSPNYHNKFSPNPTSSILAALLLTPGKANLAAGAGVFGWIWLAEAHAVVQRRGDCDVRMKKKTLSSAEAVNKQLDSGGVGIVPY